MKKQSKSDEKLLKELAEIIDEELRFLIGKEILFNDMFFSDFEITILEISKEYKISYEDVKTMCLRRLNYLFDIKRIGLADSEVLTALYSIGNVLLFPLNNYSMKTENKTYSNFNINIEFFEKLRSLCVVPSVGNIMLAVHSFEFINKKLSWVVLKFQYNILYKYNENYELEEMTFADNTKLKVKE